MVVLEQLVNSVSCVLGRPLENYRLNVQVSREPIFLSNIRVQPFTGCLFDILIGFTKSIFIFIDAELEDWARSEEGEAYSGSVSFTKEVLGAALSQTTKLSLVHTFEVFSTFSAIFPNQSYTELVQSSFKMGWTNGIVLTIATNSLNRIIYFLCLEKIHKTMRKSTILQVVLPIVAVNVAGICCYPFDTIRRNQIISGGSIVDTAQQIWNVRGWHGFFYGLGWHCLRLSTISMIRIGLFYFTAPGSK